MNYILNYYNYNIIVQRVKQQRNLETEENTKASEKRTSVSILTQYDSSLATL